MNQFEKFKQLTREQADAYYEENVATINQELRKHIPDIHVVRKLVDSELENMWRSLSQYKRHLLVVSLEIQKACKEEKIDTILAHHYKKVTEKCYNLLLESFNSSNYS